MTTDFSDILIPGDWQHEFVAANGARFHVALAGPSDSSAPLVMLLHSFPQFWWVWRDQITALAEAGYRVAAMDLRGTGASDKPPIGYDLHTRTRDVAGVIRSLGADRAVVVGHGLGGVVAWSMPALQPVVTAAVAALAAPHPARMHVSLRASLSRRAQGRLAYLQLPNRPERRMTRGDLVAQVLRARPDFVWPEGAVETYTEAARVPFAAHSSLEAVRWYARLVPTGSGRRYLSAVRAPIAVPALQVQGGLDPVVRPETADVDSSALCRELRYELLPDAGHFLPEEASEQVSAILLDWLSGLSGPTTDA